MSRRRADRLPVLFGVFCLALLGIAARVVHLGGAAAPAAAADDAIHPQRGAIWDRFGRLLATETYDRYEIMVDKEHVDDPAALAAAIGPALRLPVDELARRLASKEMRWETLERFALPETAEAIEAAGSDALTARQNPSRSYPFGADVAHLVGFVDYELNAHFGIEEANAAVLSGLAGQRPGRFRTDPGRFVPAIDGADLVLTIDTELQMAAMDILARTIDEQSASGGTVIVLDPATGALLASASMPTFDPNDFTSYDAQRFVDPAIGAIYPPGSIVKPLTLAAAIDAGLLVPGSTYNDEAVVRMGGIGIVNPDRLGHGISTMQDMLTLSLNVGASHVARTLGPDRFYGALHAFGLGRPTGIDVAGEVGGLMATPGDDGWSEERFAFNSFGQGMSVTPLQLAVAIGALANEGRRMRPYAVAATIRASGEVQVSAPQLAAQVVAPATARTLTEMLEEVVRDKATAAAIPGIRVAGKTGTSEIPGTGEENATIASFAGYFPADAPSYVILVKIDRPEEASGTHVAAPLFREVAEETIRILGPVPPRAADPVLAAAGAGGTR